MAVSSERILLFCKKPGDYGVEEMSQTLILRGKHVLTDPRRKEKGAIRDGAIAIEGDRITAVDLFDDLKKQKPGAKILGNGKQLLMPGLVDAHSHGRGM